MCHVVEVFFLQRLFWKYVTFNHRCADISYIAKVAMDIIYLFTCLCTAMT